MQTLSNYGVRNSDTHRERLIHLHDVQGLSWREIAKLDEYKTIPAGTLYSFAKTDYEPKDPDLRAKLGLPVRVEVEGRLCACGCGAAFAPKSSRHNYVDRRHRWRHQYQLKKGT
jgi:hypothetical protein